jgi:DNA-binding MarR family transcriptional regulator
MESPQGETQPGCRSDPLPIYGTGVVTPVTSQPFDRSSHVAWRSYIQSHRSILRELDAKLSAQHGVTARDYEVLLYHVQSPDHRLPMTALAERTMLTRSGITRLVDGLVSIGLIERVCCPTDGRVSYAQLTNAGYQRVLEARADYGARIHRLFSDRFSRDEIEQLASLLGRLPGAQHTGFRTIA